jgi:hypothetical protein
MFGKTTTYLTNQEQAERADGMVHDEHDDSMNTKRIPSIHREHRVIVAIVLKTWWRDSIYETAWSVLWRQGPPPVWRPVRR